MVGQDRRLLAAALIVAATATATACGRKGPDRTGFAGIAADKAAPEPRQAEGYAAQGRMAQAPAAPPPASLPPAGPAPAAAQPVQAMAAARKLIRTGQLTLEVASYKKAAEEAGRIVEGLGGYVADTRASRGDDDSQQGTISLRIPAERFSAAFAELARLGRVRAETVSTQDVTKAYADLETRLRIKRETVERLREILRGRTAKLSDVLEVERELARLTEEIEQIEGERRYYDHEVALSSLSLVLREPEAVVRGGFLEPIRKALRDSLEVLGSSIAALVYFVVFAAPWVPVLWLLWRGVRALRARARKKAVAGA